MPNESEPSAFDRLSNEAKKLFQDVQVRALIRGAKPAVYLGPNGNASTADVPGIRGAFSSLGIDAVVLPGFVGDRAQIESRLEAEPELAKLVGWDASLSVEKNMSRPETTAPAKERNHGLLAFVLGYPESAIESFVRLSEMDKRGVPTNYREFFIPRMNPSIADRIRDERGTKALARLAIVGQRAEKARDEAFEHAVTSDDRAKAQTRYNQMLREHEMEVRSLLKSHWNLTDGELGDIFVRTGIRFRNAAGEDLYFFTTSGENAENAPDIVALEARLAKTEGPIAKVVERYS